MKSQAFAVKKGFAVPGIHAAVGHPAKPAVKAPGATVSPAAPRPRDKVFKYPIWRLDPGKFIPRPDPPLRRSELKVPAAPTGTPADTDVFESADGSKRHVLPRYALAFDKVGLVEEPRIVIADRNGTPTLVLTLNKTPSPAAGSDTSELLHALAVTLKYRVPVVSGGDMVQELPFPTVLLDATETVVTAELPLTTPGQRQQILAALSSLAAGATLVVGRVIRVGVPSGETLPDGAPGYRERERLLDWTVQPPPLLSQAQRDRLGGGSGGVQPLIRHRIAFGGKDNSYWQDPVQPERFYFLPDRFLLARASEGDQRPPLLRVGSVALVGDDTPRIALEFQARPVIDAARLEAARPELERHARQRGGTGELDLEIVPDPQPLLRLALPQNGALSPDMTVRSGAQIDLETGLVHAETMLVNDFQLIYQALLGASLTLLQGEVRAVSGGDPEDIPLELRIDKTAGDVLSVLSGAVGPEGMTYTLTNAIESPVRIDRLAATATVGDRVIPLRVDRLTPGQRLLPGEKVDIVLVAPEPIPASGPAAILIDQSDVVVEADGKKIWESVFHKMVPPTTTRQVSVEAPKLLFSPSPDRPEDRVAAFVVTVENGGSVRLNEDEPKGTTTVQFPLELLEPLITGKPVLMPPIRYVTETLWASGGIGVSQLREASGNILFPVKTAPREGQ